MTHTERNTDQTNIAAVNQGIISATLPIEINDGIFLNPVKARECGKKLSGHYISAEPFPHIVIDDFLPKELIDKILNNFPIEEIEKNAKEYELNYAGIQKNKRQVFPNDCNEFCRNTFSFFNSAPFVQFLEGLTAIDGIISDPYFNGGGFHEIFRGGKLAIHADFRINEQLHLNRRLNVLIYLNKDWNESYGGCLELWDKSMNNKVQSIAPVYNRCVIFNTDGASYHGHPEPLNCPQQITRKSIALYYYTASKAVYEEVPNSTTMYVSRPEESAYTKKQAVKLRIKNYAKDFLPPIIFRKLRSLKQRTR